MTDQDVDLEINSGIEGGWLGDREFSAEERKKAEEAGHAMEGGSFPIKTKADLRNAMQALGRASNRAATIRHIKKRAKALGVDLPEGWPNDSADEASVDDEPELELDMDDTWSAAARAKGEAAWIKAGQEALAKKRKQKKKQPPPQDSDCVQSVDSHILRDGESYRMVDTIVLDRTKVTRRGDGYLSATPRVARTGIQLYRGSELDDEREILRVYRAPEQVFNRDSAKTFSSRPITSDHPPDMVTADNWRQHAVGYTGEDILRDGEFIRVPMTLCDGQTIRDFESGKRELSVGYTCDIAFENGKTADGEEYDAVQKNIRVNHVAFVSHARGGDKLAFGDTTTDQEVPEMNMKTITVDGTSCPVPEHSVGPIMRALDAKNALIAKLQADQGEPDEDDQEEKGKKKKKAEEDAATIATLMKQMDALKAQLSPDAMQVRIAEMADVTAKAKAALGDDVNFAGKDVAAIRRAVVLARMGDEAAQWSDDAIAASFKTLTRDAPVATGYRDAAAAISAGLQSPQINRGNLSAADAAYYKRAQDTENAWRRPAK
jgi:hypothetical protein